MTSLLLRRVKCQEVRKSWKKLKEDWKEYNFNNVEMFAWLCPICISVEENINISLSQRGKVYKEIFLRLFSFNLFIYLQNILEF